MKIGKSLLSLSLPAAVALCLFSCSAGKAPREPAHAGSSVSPYRLGNHHFPISIHDAAAQAAFDRGVTLAYAFNHRAAERQFREAASHDPSAPMPWWGVALVNGPHINFPLVPDENAKTAWDALGRAQQLMGNGSSLEKDLIDALAARYRSPQPKDRAPLDRSYAAAMREVWMKYPANADVGTLYAEALMDLHPWDLWTISGDEKPWTPEIIRTIEAAIAIDPDHPGANHLYIHAVESSNAPERGVPSADILCTLVPGAGHLVHMPAHIYVRVGRWEDAAISNENAIKADEEFRRYDPEPPGFYALYMLHNHHFLAFTRMMQGQKAAALKAAREMLAGIPAEFMRDFGPFADGYFAIVPEVLVRFGDWEGVLAEPQPPAGLPIAHALWRFARITAYTALDRYPEARAEHAKFKAAVKKVPADATFGNNRAHTLLTLAGHVIDGETAARQNKFGPAIRSLTIAVQLEDALKYDEPPDWILPVRHTLGITLLNAGKPKQAERVYREDLRKFPGNGWSLYGLSRALGLQGREKEAAEAEAQFRKEWANSDTAIHGSCLCQRGDRDSY